MGNPTVIRMIGVNLKSGIGTIVPAVLFCDMGNFGVPVYPMELTLADGKIVKFSYSKKGSNRAIYREI